MLKMIESELFKDVERDFEEFKKAAKANEEFSERMCYLFEHALEDIKNKHLEIALSTLCTIIESVASKKYCAEHASFDQWLVEDKANRLDKFVEEIKAGGSAPEEVVKKWFELYRDTYGIRKNFVKIIKETYQATGNVPGFMENKTEKIGGRRVSTFGTASYKKEDELWSEFERALKYIYDKYRSPFVHAGEFLGFDVKICTMTGGMSLPRSISLQTMADIALHVMRQNLIADS